MDKQHIRYCIKTRSLLELNATQIHEELIAASGDYYVWYPTIVRWLRAFFAGRESLEDNPRSGRPITAVTQNNIDAVKDLVDEDPHISNDNIATIVDTILEQYLHLRKISSRWVPYELTQEQRQRRVNICTENLTKFESGAWRLCDVITRGETWVYHGKIESKQRSKAWVAHG